MGEGGRTLLSQTCSGYPSKSTDSRHLNFGGIEEERERFFTSGQGRDGWKLPTFIAPASLMSQHVCLEKYPCYTEISLCVYIAASSTGVRFRRLPTARHCSRKAERGLTQPAKPLSPFPKSLSLLAFLIPKQSSSRGTLPPFLRGKGDFSSLRKAGKTFLATHIHFHPLFLLLRPPQISHPLLQYVPFGGGKRLISAALSN